MIFALDYQSFWIVVFYVLLTGHFTSISSSLYLHRSVTHRGVEFVTPISFLMRLWLWLATSISTKEWVACHRKHHAFPDQHDDPHSPVTKGFFSILFGGVFYYRKAVRDTKMVEKFGKGCPDDWLERKLFIPYKNYGKYILLIINLLLFGIYWGIAVWGIQVIWMIVIGQVINGMGHSIGYRNSKNNDHSTNIIPFGIWIAGEELHNNHHGNPASPKFSKKWFEFDIGWLYIRILQIFKLAKVRYSTHK